MIGEQEARLLAARLDAINRGDKALGRELYHQLFELGMAPHEIDAWTADSTPQPEPEPDAPSEPETADAPAPPERAVPRRAKRG